MLKNAAFKITLRNIQIKWLSLGEEEVEEGKKSDVRCYFRHEIIFNQLHEMNGINYTVE